MLFIEPVSQTTVTAIMLVSWRVINTSPMLEQYIGSIPCGTPAKSL